MKMLISGSVMQNETVSNNSSENMTSLSGGPAPMSDYVKVVVTIAYIGVIIMAVGGNLLVCGIVITQKRMRTVTNYFLFSLACSDLLMATLCIPFTFIANVLLVQHWPFGRAMCPIMLYSQVGMISLALRKGYVPHHALQSGRFHCPFGSAMCPVMLYSQVGFTALSAGLCAPSCSTVR